MKVKINVLDAEKYLKVSDIDASGLTGNGYGGGLDGHLTIELVNGQTMEIDGEIGKNDYIENFGFSLSSEF